MADLGRILIADDEETFILSTADLLRKEGYECECVPNAAAAAQMLRSADYDVVIADIKMPGNFELELVREITDIAKGMPVILVTGYPSLNSAIQSIQLPVVAYLVKPFDFDQLLSQVQISIKNFRVYRTLCSIRRRLQDWRKDVAGIEGVLRATPRSASSAPVDAFLKLTFRNIVDSLSDLRQLTEGIALENVGQKVCHLFNCPRLRALKEGLVESIDVLEETKSAFRSKKLGELRRKLEGLLQEAEEKS
ncbi:MAG: response regulator [Candidatus Zixiibacteriota bacterium]